MVKWREEFSYLKDRKSWDEVFNFLEKTSAENPDDVEVYIETICFLSDLLLEDRGINFELEADKIAKTLKDIFDKSYKRFSENAEYLFFVGHFMALSDWLFGDDISEISHQMQKKAAELEPENILYKWGSKIAINPALSGNRVSEASLAKQVLSDSEKMNWLKSKGMAGEWMIDILKSSSKSMSSHSD